MKYALITDGDKTFSTDSGFRIVTYSSVWDSMGWTALKELSKDAAETIGHVLLTEGWVVVRTKAELKAMMEAEKQAVLEL